MATTAQPSKPLQSRETLEIIVPLVCIAHQNYIGNHSDSRFRDLYLSEKLFGEIIYGLGDMQARGAWRVRDKCLA